jgi:glycolate oxidase
MAVSRISNGAALSPELERAASRLAGILQPNAILSRPSELVTYSADGLPFYRKRPALAVFPETREELIAVVRALADEGIPFVPRGAGTGLSGGALAENDAVIIFEGGAGTRLAPPRPLH